MTAEEAIAIIRIAQHHAANEYVNAKMTEVMALIRRQADDLAAIEKAFESGADINVYHHNIHNPPWAVTCWRDDRVSYQPTLADACRAATKGAGQ